MEQQVQVLGTPLCYEDADDHLQELFRFHQENNARFYRGDAVLEGWVQDEGVTLHGGFDESVRGWDALARVLPLAASRLMDGEITFTPLGGRIIGDMAYVAGFEAGLVRRGGGAKQPIKLRVTMVYQRLKGEWKAIHRHGEIVSAS